MLVCNYPPLLSSFVITLFRSFPLLAGPAIKLLARIL